ncbi:hypothetical protein E4U13_003731 [Claviceps humidiphila]|uniref:Uncharacterized protein n=1 Tax=Claviceps humidiphila TaxID=1294629 RepID=A0A9P7PZG2_9HYPO|nr:hypothetical protein E4U13_003731 [Claviceps humidiphila]
MPTPRPGDIAPRDGVRHSRWLASSELSALLVLSPPGLLVPLGVAGFLRVRDLAYARRAPLEVDIRDHSAHLVCESQEMGQGAGVGGTGA